MSWQAPVRASEGEGLWGWRGEGVMAERVGGDGGQLGIV